MELCDKFYSMVPKDYKGNIKWRKEVLDMCRDDYRAQQDFWDMCSRDILFYINTFQFTLNPRSIGEAVIPFITYDYQDEFIREVLPKFGREDIGVEKSRDMGATWMWLMLIEYHWRFGEYLSFLLISQKQEMVYKKGNEKALFSKIEFLHRFQPPWLMPEMQMVELLLRNMDNNCTITGESTTKTSSTGDRATAVFCDEFAKLEINDGYKILQSTRAVTNCRIFNSTHFGINNAFYDLTKGDKKFKNVYQLPWWKHPEFKKGLYRVGDDGFIEILDKDYVFGDYVFRPEKPANPHGLRSVWYDKECDRVLSAHEMAEEVDMNPVGGAFQFFHDVVKRIYEKCMIPIKRGELLHDDKGAFQGWEDDEEGGMKLWTVIDERTGRPLAGSYGMGVDISAGTGTSNSTISVVNFDTGEKVCEVVRNDLMPYQWAQYVIAVAEFFHNAFVAYEANGPTGREFGITLKDLGYYNIYYRQNKETGRETTAPGWHSDPDTKAMLLGEYRQALASGAFINYSKPALDECLEYIREANGDLVHRKSKNMTDLSVAGQSHGDRVIADALANWIMKDHDMYGGKDEEIEVPPYSLAGRLQAEKREKIKKEAEILNWDGLNTDEW